jgi:predicted signal transduction protein with EAL and GGDEF domain
LSNIEILSSSALAPANSFVLQEFSEKRLNFFNNSNMIESLVIEFPKSVHSYIKSNPLQAKEIELTESNTAPGFFRLNAKQVNNNQRFQQWLLGFNNMAQVIEPFELRQIINHSDLDKLTNLYNRNVFERLLYREIDWCHRDSSHYFSLLIMDIDHFKQVNDQ